MLTSKQKSFLRSKANHLKPVFQIGKDGITEEFLTDVLAYLNKHELMKISILQNSDVTFDMCKAAFDVCEIEICQHIGRTLVIYKHSDNAVDPIKF